MEFGDILLVVLMGTLFVLVLLFESPRIKKQRLILLLCLVVIFLITVVPGVVRRLLR